MKCSTRRFGTVALGLFIFAAVQFPAYAQQASVYKWVDEEGTPHFTDRPPEGVDAVRLPLSYHRTDRRAIRQLLDERAKSRNARLQEASKRAAESAEQQAERQQAAEERKANCARARGILKKYTDAMLIYDVDDNGERVYLSADELDAIRENARKSVEEWCDE